MKFYANKHINTNHIDGVCCIPDGSIPDAPSEEHVVIEIDEALYKNYSSWIDSRSNDECIKITTEEAKEILEASDIDYDFYPETPSTIDATSITVNETITISNLPNPTYVRIPAIGNYTIIDGTLEVQFTRPGKYDIYIKGAKRYSTVIYNIEVSK